MLLFVFFVVVVVVFFVFFFFQILFFGIDITGWKEKSTFLPAKELVLDKFNIGIPLFSSPVQMYRKSYCTSPVVGLAAALALAKC